MRQKLSLKPLKSLSSRFKIYSLIFFVSITIFLLAIFLIYYFQIKNIIIQGNIPRNEIIGIENLKDNNLLLLSDQIVEENIIQNNPQIKKVTIDKIYPKTLLLKVEVNEASAYLKLNKGFAALSDEGKIIYKSENIDQNLPVINYYQQFDFFQLGVGSKLEYKDLTTALFLLLKAQNLNLKIDSIDINGLSMIVFNLKDKKIFLTSEKDRNDQAFELETIVKEFKIEAKDFKTLDLRFEKPIVSF